MPAAKKKKKKKKAKKEAEHKSLWQNYDERQINTNARVKWKMAALIRQANNWQRAMWQRLETRNPCTQYQPHKDANSHWTLNRRSRSTHIKKYKKFIKLSGLARHLEVTPITLTSKKNEATQEAKGNAKRGKTNWIVGVYTKKLTDPNTKP